MIVVYYMNDINVAHESAIRDVSKFK